jgi:hypothetical protein
LACFEVLLLLLTSAALLALLRCVGGMNNLGCLVPAEASPAAANKHSTMHPLG